MENNRFINFVLDYYKLLDTIKNDEEFKNRLQKKVEEICRSFHYDKADISFMKHDAGKWN